LRNSKQVRHQGLDRDSTGWIEIPSRENSGPIEFVNDLKTKMNKKISTIITIILLCGISIPVAKEYPPLKVNWEYRIKANKLYYLDWDNDGVEELLIFSYLSRGSKKRDLYLYILDQERELELKTKIPGWGTYSSTTYTAADERMYGAYAVDIDDNGNLDVFTCDWITWASLNVHKFYRLERTAMDVGGTTRHPLKLQWTYEGAGLITDIDAIISENGSKIIAACLEDACIYGFTPTGGVAWKSDLDGGVWDILLVDVDRDHITDIVAGTFRSISLVSNTGVLKWSYPTDETVRGVYSADLDGDGDNEVVGASKDNMIYLIDSKGNLKKKFDLKSAGIRFRSIKRDPIDKIPLIISDFDNNGDSEIILASDDMKLYSFNKEFGHEWNHSMNESILSLRLIDDGLTKKTLLVGTTNTLYSVEMNHEYVRNREAEGYYKLALRCYVDKNYNDALKYANLAKDIFAYLNDTEGVLKCERILILGQNNTANATASNKMKLANEYFEKAESYYTDDKLNNATEYAERAKSLYAELDYEEGVMNCDLLIEKIDERREEIRQNEKKIADEYLFKAQVSYDSKDYEGVGSYAGKAKEIYIKIDEKDGVVDCNSLIMKVDKYLNATDLYEKASRHLELRHYENASQYADRAKKLYLELDDKEMVAECERIVDTTMKYPIAEGLYQKATEFYDDRKYDKAIEYIRKAKGIYLELNDENGIQKCDSLLSEIEKKKSEWYMDYLPYIVGGIVILILIIIVFLVVRRRKEKATMEGKGAAGDTMEGKGATMEYPNSAQQVQRESLGLRRGQSKQA